jgi:ectoine hydroxylase-related dioxygenase (phytanoyl-CoA dioxygenase family)
VTGPDGDEHACQLHYTSLNSELIANLEGDPRITELVASVDRSLVAHPTIGNGHFAVLKNPGVAGGLTDLAWHVDCGLGGHPILCPSLHIGIQVREMTVESGPMMFLAGSHHSTSVRPTPDQERTWPVVRVTAKPGDITLHSPDAVHAAPPPTGSVEGRRTLYMAFGRPELAEIFGFKEGYDHLIFPKEGHVEFEA